MALPNPTQQRVMDALVAGHPAPGAGPAPLAQVQSHDWGREGKTVVFHRFLRGSLAPELYRIYADGSVSRH